MTLRRLLLLVLAAAPALSPLAGGLESEWRPVTDAFPVAPGPTYAGLINGETLVWNRPAPHVGYVLSHYQVWGRDADGLVHHLKSVPPVSMFASVPPGYEDYAVVPVYEGRPAYATWACWYVALDPPEVTFAKCDGADAASMLA